MGAVYRATNVEVESEVALKVLLKRFTGYEEVRQRFHAEGRIANRVQHPGAVSFRSSDRMTLLTAIARAGGLSDRASNKMVIKREGAGRLIEEVLVDYKAVLAGRIPDPTLKEGDVIVVKESFF